MQFTVAIDGPAAAGKGTLSRAVAEHFGFSHLDTGLLYRAVGIKTLNRCRGVIDPKVAVGFANDLTEKDFERHDLRAPRTAQAASKVAALPEVRAALIAFQKRFARQEGGAVLDGRDIGTVICPEAEVKLFVTADDTVRAQRRFAEITAGGGDTTLDAVLADVRSRDARDSGRADAPLKPAEDALLLDTTELSIDAAVAQAVSEIKNRLDRVG
ncbi:MAG: (d)CMP kinase [Pseudomonadota bacterium]